MPWCPKCKNEYREGITVCVDCNVELVDDLSKAVSSNKMLVFSTEDKSKTEDFIKYLEYSGIHSYSVETDENDYIHSLYVSEDDYMNASKLFTGFALTESERAPAAAVEEDDVAPPYMDDAEDAEEIPAENEYDIDDEEISYSLRQPSHSSYVRKSERAKDYLFSAYALLTCGVCGVIFIILNMLGIINLVAVTFSQIVLMFVFIAFFISGIIMYFNSRSIDSEAADESRIENSVTEWLKSNVTESYLMNIRDESVSDEINYFKYCEAIKTALAKDVPEASESMVDSLMDDHLSEILQ